MALVMRNCADIAAAGCIPKFLKAAVELKVVEMLANAGPGAKLSASELVAKMPTPTTNPNAEATLDRILHFLADYSILTSDKLGPDGKRRYGLTPICQELIPDENGVSFAPTLFLADCNQQILCWQFLKDAVLEGSVPFEKANGGSFYEVISRDAGTQRVFADAMHGMSVKIMKAVLDGYTGFRGLKEVVDVGGGPGTALTLLVSKYPHIRGINFDLPAQIDTNPPIPGVEHVGGDMFESVPSGNAIILKWVLHNWGDELCVKILRNCWKALPDSGKVIVVEFVLQDDINETGPCPALSYDVWMIANFNGGKERSLGEYEALAKMSGFCEIKAFPMSIYGLAAIEFYKIPTHSALKNVVN